MRNPEPQRLDYIGGEFHYVFPDDIPLVAYNKVCWYAQQARIEIDEFLRTIELRHTVNLKALYEQIDNLVFDLAKPYYVAIAKLAHIPDIDNLTSTSRYEFFVQRLVFEGDQMKQLPSQLDLLLGAESDDGTVEKSDKEVPTSGNLIWDIEVSLRLTFKHNASSMIRTKGLVSCLGMLGQASQQLKMAQDEAEEMYGDKKTGDPFIPVTEADPIGLEHKPLDPTFAKELPAIAKGLNIKMPRFD